MSNVDVLVTIFQKIGLHHLEKYDQSMGIKTLIFAREPVNMFMIRVRQHIAHPGYRLRNVKRASVKYVRTLRDWEWTT
jgi:hypothetical protein